jgi:hypothetical protein
LEARANEADALRDDDRFEAHHELARAYFRCSKSIVDNPYLADSAMFSYALQLHLSAHGDDALDRWRQTAQILSDLAAETRFADIRSRAIYVRDAMRRTAEKVGLPLFDTPAPAESTAP